MSNRYHHLTFTLLVVGLVLMGLGLMMVGSAPALAQEDDPTPTIITEDDEAPASEDDEAAAEGEEAAQEATEESSAEASTAAQDVTEEQMIAVPEEINDDYCFVCHTDTEKTIVFPDGATMNVSVDPAVIEQSVHGAALGADELGCVDCHGEKRYPHEEPLPATERQYTIRQSALCSSCHEEQAGELADSVHYSALVAGNESAATCIDCHGAHDVQPPEEPRERLATTCGTCHTAVFDEYATSVHGESLMAGDPNVPTCVDCHGVHGIQHPTTALFRNRSPELCADCHANEEMMAEYDITTNVFNSYLTDFHGTTVALFEQQDPNTPSNKAVCFDCHGVHDIQRADAETSQVVRENLLDTCQQCHPDATSDFPASWVGHFPPTLESHPLMFAVDLFYKILIPVVMIGFVVLVASDIIRRIRERVGGRKEH